jgi:hypothetical protein
LHNLKPIISLIFIIGTLFSIVFLQMEERRRGYAILKLTREQRNVIEEKRERSMQLAKLTRPEHVEKLAQSQFTLKKVQANQIIHMTGLQNSENSIAITAGIQPGRN